MNMASDSSSSSIENDGPSSSIEKDPPSSIASNRPSSSVSVDPYPFVSVILPVLNEAAYLAGAVEPILTGDYPADRMEILVVDGGSADGTRALAERLAWRDGRVRLLDNPRRTTPAALNVGIGAARGEVIVRMDGHARPAPDYVRACVAALGRTGAWAVGGLMVGIGETDFGRAVALATRTPLGAGDARFRLAVMAGPTDTVYLGAWPRSVFDRVGLFDERLVRNQDYELCIRIRRAGGLVWLEPAIRSETVMRSNPWALARQYFLYGQGRSATLVLHPGSLRRRQAVPALFVAMLVGLGLVALAGAPHWIPARLLLAGIAVAYAVAMILQVLVLASVRGRPSPDLAALFRLPLAYFIIHITWGAGFWWGLARALAGVGVRIRRPA